MDRRALILQTAARLVARRGVRGLRIDELAQEAGVSQGLIYYHFDDRAGLLLRTLEFVGERAGGYTEQAAARAATARERLELTLQLELQDDPQVAENSAAWGELRASAKFEPELREALRRATEEWAEEVAAEVRAAWRERGADHHGAAAASSVAWRLTSLVEGLSERWLSGSLPLERARELLREAVAVEVDRPVLD